MSVWDPIGIFSPSGTASEADVEDATNRRKAAERAYNTWQPGMAPPKPNSPAYAQYQAYGQGQANAGAAASAAGNQVAADRYYAQGGKWRPGMPPPKPGTAAYADYQNYGRGQANAGAAASSAGNRAIDAHDARVLGEEQRQRDAAGLNFMKPGATESFYSQYGSDLMKPGSYQSWWNSNSAQMQNPGMAENYAQQVLSKYSSGSHLPPADYGAYYDRAAEKATQGLNDQLASRGQYGSSVGLGLIGNQLADLAAQRARDEADYGLRRSADERSWTTALSDVAQAGDSSSLARWSAAGQGAGLADTIGLSRWKTAQDAAESAQQAQRQRGQDLFNNARGIGGDISTITGSAYGSQFASDAALLDAILALNTGRASEGVSAAQQGANSDAATSNQLMQLLQAYYASQSQPKEAKK